ncbi:MAG: hypothetical protein AB8D52_02840 [Gammaproteobacteria bacterium]
MSKFRSAWEKAKAISAGLGEKSADIAKEVKDHIDENKDDWTEQASGYTERAKNIATEYIREGSDSVQEHAKGLYIQSVYSKEKLADLEHRVEAQGALYRELLRNKKFADSVFVGGESLATLLVATSVAPEIEAAYAAAYPKMAEDSSFLEKLISLDGEEATAGFHSGVKGKLFEQKYVDYLNENLPDGYTADLAMLSTQPGWDIQVVGPNEEIVQLLQAKATDSVAYVQEALAKYPSIDVVTTDEVYSHLVMSGVSENIENGEISNIELAEQVEAGASAADIDFSLAPPVFTLAFIAFTSYREESLTLYEKAKAAGDRSGKTYFAYLVGGGIAALTNTWWLGVLGSISSRYMSDEGLGKAKLVESMKNTYQKNQEILTRLKSEPSAA